jgi:hypothetical protein
MYVDRFHYPYLPVLLVALIGFIPIGGTMPAYAATHGRAWSPTTAAVLHALLPHGAPALPYTLYRNAGPIEHTARVEALLVRGVTAIAAIAMESRPQTVRGIDPQGAWLLGIVSNRNGRVIAVAHSSMPRTPTFAGSLRAVSLTQADPGRDDVSLRFTTTLSGSGGSSISYLQIFRQQAGTLQDEFTVQTDNHIAVSSCCTYGTAAAVQLLRGGKSPQYGVRQWGYTRTGAGTQTYALPGVIRYVQTATGYAPDALILAPQRAVPVRRLPVVAALPASATVPALATAAAVTVLPGAINTLVLAGSSLTAAQLYAGWTASRLDLLLRTAAAWPADSQPTRIDLSLQPGLKGPIAHLAISSQQAGCRGGVGYGGTGWECSISIPAATAFGHALPAATSLARSGSRHHYSVAAFCGLAVRLFARNKGQTVTAALGPAATTLSTVLVLQPSA